MFEDEVPLHLAAALAQVDPAAAGAAVDELVRADVLAPRDPLGFRHPLLRAAVYGAIPARRRGELHARRGAAVHRRGGGRRAGVRAPAAVAVGRGRRGGGDPAVSRRQSAGRRRRRTPRSSTWSGPCGSRRRHVPVPPCSPSWGMPRRSPVGPRPCSTWRRRSRWSATRGSAPSCCWPSAGHCTTAAGWGRPATAFRRGLDELRGAAAEHERVAGRSWRAAISTSALFTPARAADAHAARSRSSWRGAPALTGAGELALLSKALMMRLWAGEDREAVLATARRLVGDGRLSVDDAADSQVPWQVIASLSWADDYASAGLALRGAFADARRGARCSPFALAGVLSARQMLWTGPVDEAVHDARTALAGPAARIDLPLVGGLLPGLRAARAGATATRRPRCRMSLAGSAEPPFFAAWRVMAEGRLGRAPRGRRRGAGGVPRRRAAARRAADREPGRAALAIRGRAGRPAPRPARPGGAPWSPRSSGSPSGSAPRGRSGSPAARPGCSPAATTPSSCSARRPTSSAAAAPGSSTRARSTDLGAAIRRARTPGAGQARPARRGRAGRGRRRRRRGRAPPAPSCGWPGAARPPRA